jgi:lipopolysaccharide transport system ATP-binding protein
MSEIAIRAEQIGKRFFLGETVGTHTLRYAAQRLATEPWRAWRRVARGESAPLPEVYEAFWALRHVDFELRRGEVLGVIGANGAGKSTLLKLLSRITAPTEGRIEIRGRVSSLLEVGTGFHRMRKAEIDRKFDAIVAFAGIEKFLDTPVKRYSSGMHTRLAFSVAAHLEPEILIVDEVLAVGDVGFQKKCLGKMNDLAQGGRTVVFVSHNMGAVSQLCNCGLLLDGGHVQLAGEIGDVVRGYLERSIGDDCHSAVCAENPSLPSQFTSVALRSARGGPVRSCDEPIAVESEYLVREERPGLYFTFYLQTDQGAMVLFSDVRDVKAHGSDRYQPGLHRFRIELPPRLLAPGTYYVSFDSGVGGHAVHNFRNRVSFTLSDLSSPRATRPGVHGALLDWNHERLPEKELEGEAADG